MWRQGYPVLTTPRSTSIQRQWHWTDLYDYAGRLDAEMYSTNQLTFQLRGPARNPTNIIVAVRGFRGDQGFWIYICAKSTDFFCQYASLLSLYLCTGAVFLAGPIIFPLLILGRTRTICVWGNSEVNGDSRNMVHPQTKHFIAPTHKETVELQAPLWFAIIARGHYQGPVSVARWSLDVQSGFQWLVTKTFLDQLSPSLNNSTCTHEYITVV